MSKTIEIVAPSSGEHNLQKIQDCAQKLSELGYNINVPDDLTGGDLKYEANRIEYRLHHLINAAADKNTFALMALKGGYSSGKVANQLMALDSFPAQSKFIVGFSDLTALFLALNQKHNWLCIHGLMLTSLANNKLNPRNIEQTLAILEGHINSLTIPDLRLLNDFEVKGNIKGNLIGGNLSVIQSSIGTSWQIDCKDKILFLEDVGEPAYKVDRMLTQLQQAHILDNVKAVVVGDFYKLDEEDGARELLDYTLQQFANNMSKLNCPVFKSNAFGHYHENTPLVIGADAEIDFNYTNQSSVNENSLDVLVDFSLNYSWPSFD